MSVREAPPPPAPGPPPDLSQRARAPLPRKSLTASTFDLPDAGPRRGTETEECQRGAAATHPGANARPLPARTRPAPPKVPHRLHLRPSRRRPQTRYGDRGVSERRRRHPPRGPRPTSPSAHAPRSPESPSPPPPSTFPTPAPDEVRRPMSVREAPPPPAPGPPPDLSQRARAPLPRKSFTASTSDLPDAGPRRGTQTEECREAPPPPTPGPPPDLSQRARTPLPQKSLTASTSDLPDAGPRRAPSSSDLLRDELERTIGRGASKEDLLVKKRGPAISIVISDRSPPSEIHLWFQEKGFSKRTQEVMKTQSGRALFGFSKGQLMDLCGREEGQRLASLLLVQKKLSGYETRSGAELAAILNLRKSAAEGPESETRVSDPGDRANSLSTLFTHHSTPNL